MFDATFDIFLSRVPWPRNGLILRVFSLSPSYQTSSLAVFHYSPSHFLKLRILSLCDSGDFCALNGHLSPQVLRYWCFFVQFPSQVSYPWVFLSSIFHSHGVCLISRMRTSRGQIICPFTVASDLGGMLPTAQWVSFGPWVTLPRVVCVFGCPPRKVSETMLALCTTFAFIQCTCLLR